MSDTALPAALEAEALAERREDKAFGFWVYLMTDGVIFALLFATYVVMTVGTAGGPAGADLFNLTRTFGETMLLLVSSTTFGMASVASRQGDRRAVLIWLVVTAALGAGFVFMEVQEFSGMIAQGAGPDRSGFLSAFFTLVGTHGAPRQRRHPLHPRHARPDRHQGADAAGRFAPVPAWAVLAFPRHRLDRHLFDRLPAWSVVRWRKRQAPSARAPTAAPT